MSKKIVWPWSRIEINTSGWRCETHVENKNIKRDMELKNNLLLEDITYLDIYWGCL